MIKGIPYWGKETFSDMRNLEKQVNIKEKSMEELGVDSIYTLFYKLARENVVIRIKEGCKYFYSYVRDICFNYRDRVILIPYWSYEEAIEIFYSSEDKPHLDTLEDGSINIKHSFKLMYNLIDNRQTKERNDYLEIYDTENKELYKVRIKDVPYICEKEFSIEGLHDRYVSSAYYFIDSDDYAFENRYHKIEREKGYNTEYKIRKMYNLKHFVAGIGEYSLLNYKDFRHYKYHELNEIIPIPLEDRKGYWERRYLFEAYLYCIFSQNLNLKENEYKDKLQQLGLKSRVLKYDKKGIPLFLKYYYKDNITLSKKTYENYIKI